MEDPEGPEPLPLPVPNQLQRIMEYFSEHGPVITPRQLLTILPDARHMTKGGIYDWFQTLREHDVPVTKYPRKGWLLGEFTDAERETIVDAEWRHDTIHAFRDGQLPVVQEAGFEHSRYFEVDLDTRPLPSPLTVVEMTFDPQHEHPSSIRLLEFEERSHEKTMLFGLLRHAGILTYEEIVTILKQEGIDPNFYVYSAVYRWFDRLRQKVTPALLNIPQLGWGLPNTDDSTNAEEKVACRLQQRWETSTIERLNAGTLPFVYEGHAAGNTFYFPKYITAALPQPNFVVLQRPEGDQHIIDFEMKSPTRRAFEATLRDGYLDPASLAAAKKSDWYRAELNDEMRRVARNGGKIGLPKGEEATPSTFEHIISNLNALLRAASLPLMREIGNGEGFSLDGQPDTRNAYIQGWLRNQLLLDKPIKEYLIDRHLRGLPGVASVYFPLFDTRFVLIDLQQIRGKLGELPFRFPAFRPHTLLIERKFFTHMRSPRGNTSIMLPLTGAYVSILSKQKEDDLFVRFDTIADPRSIKHQQQIARHFLADVRREWGAFEQGTGIVTRDGFVLPIPAVDGRAGNHSA